MQGLRDLVAATRRRPRAVFVLRIALSGALLAVLVGEVPAPSLVPHLHRPALAWLMGGLAVTLAGIVLSTLRWQRVLQALGVRNRLRTLLSHQLAGLFVGNFLPSTVGGDVVRVARLSAGTGESPTSFASVVLERVSGWFVLPLITLVALLAHPALLHLGTASRVAVAISMATLGFLVVGLAVAGSRRFGGRLAHRSGLLRFAGAVHLGLEKFRRHPGAAVSVLLTGFAYQLVVVTAVWMGAEALGIRVGWVTLVAFFPAVAIAQVLPISVGGLGLREGALVLFLSRSPLQVPEAQAITLGLLVYAMNLVVSLLGAPAFAVGTRPARATA